MNLGGIVNQMYFIVDTETNKRKMHVPYCEINTWMRHAICIYEHYQGILHQYNHNGYYIFCHVGT